MSCEQIQNQLQGSIAEIKRNRPPKLWLTHALTTLKDACNNRSGRITHASRLLHQDISGSTDPDWENAKVGAGDALAFYQRTKKS